MSHIKVLRVAAAAVRGRRALVWRGGMTAMRVGAGIRGRIEGWKGML